MKGSWKKIELIGRAILLLSIGFQLVLVSEIRGIKSEGDLAYLMENQYYLALMVSRLATQTSNDSSTSAVNDAFSDIQVYSNRKKSVIYDDMAYTQYIFILLFLIGSSLMLYARHIELHEKDINNET